MFISQERPFPWTPADHTAGVRGYFTRPTPYCTVKTGLTQTQLAQLVIL